MQDNRIFYTYDIECLPNVFTCVIIHVESGTEWLFEVSERKNQSVQFLSFIRTLMQFPQVRMVGYNNMGYDWPVINFLLGYQSFTAADAFAKSKQIISAPFSDRFKHVIWEDRQLVRQCDLMKIHGFDNHARRTSLKQLEIALKMPCVVEFELDFDAPLPVKKTPDLIAYNRHDVAATTEFHKRSKELYDMRWDIGQELGVDLENKSDIDMGERLFIEALEKHTPGITGTKSRGPKRTTPRAQIDLSQILLPYIQFDTPEFQEIHRHFQTTPPITETKGVFEGLTATCHGLEFVFGTGGIHAATHNRTYRARPGRQVITVDVSSYYPNIAIKNGLAPEHLGQGFVDEYAAMYERRMAYKRAGEDVKQTASKLGLNAVFGKGGSKYSCMHDNAFMLGITVNGQLMLCMLAEKLAVIPTVEVFNVNTDGVTLAVDDDHMGAVMEVKEWWEGITRLSLDVDHWQAIYQRDVNNYLAVEPGGKVKGKGAYEWRHGLDTGSNWHKNQSCKIIAIAAEEFMINGVPVADTVNGCDDPFRFMHSLKVQRSDQVMLGGQLEDYIDALSPVHPKTGKHPTRTRHTGGARQQRVGRFYAARDGAQLWKIMAPLKKLPHHERPQAVEKGVSVAMCNDLHDFDWSRLDRDYYIQKANELVEKTGFYDGMR